MAVDTNGPSLKELVEKALYDENTRPELLQRINHRRIVIWTSIGFVLGLGGFEYYILSCLRRTELLVQDFFILFCIAPLVAATTVVTFMLLGVFKPLRDNDVEDMMKNVGKFASL